jgi:hypothetical protein
MLWWTKELTYKSTQGKPKSKGIIKTNKVPMEMLPHLSHCKPCGRLHLHEPTEGCFTSLQPWPWKVHEKYQISFLQPSAVANYVMDNCKIVIDHSQQMQLNKRKDMHELVS